MTSSGLTLLITIVVLSGCALDSPSESDLARSSEALDGSCVGACGGSAGICWCDSACTGYGDCCTDYTSACTSGGGGSWADSCAGSCGGSAGTCWCDSACTGYGDCCADFTSACSGGGGSWGDSCAGSCGGSAGTCWCDPACTGYGDCCADFTSACADGASPFTLISVGEAITGSLEVSEEALFRFNMIAGRQYHVVLLPQPGGGDIDLYTSNDPAISTTSYQCRPYLGGLDPEVCSFVALTSGENYVLVNGFEAGDFVLSVFEQGGGGSVTAASFNTAVNPPSATTANDGDGWYVAQGFGGASGHLGTDWNSEACASCDLGQTVRAAANGVVEYVADAGTGWNGVVILRHDAPTGASFQLPGGGTTTTVWSMYAHLTTNMTAWLAVGDRVQQGQPVGVIGPTPAGSTGPHLHLELRTYSGPPGAGYGALVGHQDPDAFIELN